MHTTAYWLTVPASVMAALPFAADDRRDGVVGPLVRDAAGGAAAADVRSAGHRHLDRRGDDRRTARRDAAVGASDEPRIFIYDNYPGGIGFSEPLFGMHDELLARTRELIAGCECEHGCPTCVGPVGNTGPLAKASRSRSSSSCSQAALGMTHVEVSQPAPRVVVRQTARRRTASAAGTTSRSRAGPRRARRPSRQARDARRRLPPTALGGDVLESSIGRAWSSIARRSHRASARRTARPMRLQPGPALGAASTAAVAGGATRRPAPRRCSSSISRRPAGGGAGTSRFWSAAAGSTARRVLTCGSSC